MTLDVIDAHHHLCFLSAASYPWLEGTAQKRYHGDDVPLRRDYLVPDYLHDAAGLAEIGARLVASVHIENGAADPLWEAEWVQATIARGPFPTVQVVKVDLSAPDAPEQLAAHSRRATVRGVRDILNWHPDPYYTHRDRPDLMRDPDWLRGFKALGGLGLSFDLQVFPDQLAQAARLAAEHASTRIVLDHVGMPIERDNESLAEWAKGMRLLAEEPNTTVKISALGTNDHTWTTESIRRIVLTTIEIFGPDRCMFASNFPVDGLYSTYTDVFRAFDQITARLSPSERAQLFAGTAREFYRIDTPAAGPGSGQHIPFPQAGKTEHEGRSRGSCADLTRATESRSSWTTPPTSRDASPTCCPTTDSSGPYPTTATAASSRSTTSTPSNPLNSTVDPLGERCL